MPIFCGERIASVSAAKAKTTEDPKKSKAKGEDAALAGDMALEDEKIDSSLSDDEDLLEGIPEEELKAAEDAEVNLPKVSTRASKVRHRSADTSSTMHTDDNERK